MALADTARLVASLELKDQFTATANKFDRTIGGMEQRVSTFGRVSSEVGRGLGNAATNLARIGAVGVGVLAVNVAAGIQSLRRLEEVTVATNAVIESTGGVAGISAAKVRELAEAYESINATMDDKVIQSAENLLLTFTAINEDAFEPALEAALNMNQALGGGEEGLQGTIIQVGKALQDPIRGLTALRRVGVNFTAAQQKQIKALVEANDLYGAQQLILAELGKEFGGQFAAAGDTATARFAKFQDAIEDAQMALATAFLPVLEKVTDKLTTLLADPATMAAIEEFGGTMAEAFDAVVELAGNLPWDSIKSAFEVMGTGSKALLQAFTSLPPWVQTAVLTGWGLNKLTGGALTGIVSALASGLIKGVLGINAGVVNIKAGTVTGGGTATGASAGLSGVVKTSIVSVAGAALGLAIGAPLHQAIVQPAQDFEGGAFGRRTQTPEAVVHNLEAIESELADIKNDPLSQLAIIANYASSFVTGQEPILDTLIEQRNQLRTDRLAQLSATAKGAERIAGTTERTSAQEREQARAIATAVSTAKQQQAADAARTLQAQAQAQVKLQQIADKDFSPTVAVSVTSNVTISDIQRKITSQQIAIGKGFQEFE